MKRDFVLSTTNSLEGYRIEKYLGLCSERVVVGTGLTSEFFAGFTDVFGGRSSKFEKELNNLYNQALDKVVLSARRMGATGLIGIKMDIDEISGKNMQMFMISVMGTAVLINHLQEENLIKSDLENSVISGIDLESRISAKKAINNLKNCKSVLDLDKVIMESLGTKNLHILNALLIEMNNGSKEYTKSGIIIPPSVQEASNPILYYFAMYNIEEINNILYEFVRNQENFTELFMNVFGSFALPNYKELVSLVKKIPGDSLDRMVVPVLKRFSILYNSESTNHISELYAELNEKIDYRIPTTLDIKNKEVWVCRCKKSVPVSNFMCPSCNRGRHGMQFEQAERLKSTIQYLQDFIESLNTEFATQ